MLKSYEAFYTNNGFQKEFLCKNIVMIEGIFNEFEYKNVKKMQEYHNSKYNYYFLEKIRCDLGPNII